MKLKSEAENLEFCWHGLRDFDCMRRSDDASGSRESRKTSTKAHDGGDDNDDIVVVRSDDRNMAGDGA